MYFGLTNIDDILIAIDTEKGHNELVKEVLGRLEENNLFVKPEKCRWKVRGGIPRSSN